ncbi:FAD/NAD(P)-binding oxidoreductase [Caballeronia sp. BCC1704]|uniref:NAD(P)/FAD-dependent oxidoreductase n=1 Tax=Caballeronia sp. BCC1704 TaxID=2676300 RepID=UPI00158E8759|nr:FAD/NAD(P)-binding oxidoreductase [Caballeronia sp. BCC1704]
MKFDVLIIGAGPAGLHAARVAAEAGVQVGIIDDNALPGGQIWRQGPQHAPKGSARAAIDALSRYNNMSRLCGTRVVQSLPGKTLLVEDAERGFGVGYEKLIVATGARERFLPFAGWTLPGVTGAGGLQALIKGGMPVEGQRIVIAGTGPLLWAAATTARQHGATVAAIVEQASAGHVRRFAGGLLKTPAKLLQAARMRFDLHATPFFRGAYVAEAQGEKQVTRVRVRHGDGDIDIDCDRLACAYGLVPNVQIGIALGCQIVETPFETALRVDEWQATSVLDVYAAGECTGVGGMELAALEGRIAAHAALGHREQARALFAAREAYRQFARRMHEAFTLNAELGTLAQPDTILCRCEDVAFGDASKYRSWRDAKLHTRCGMGPCQGKICGEAAAFCFGWKTDAQRPPIVPARIATLLEAQSPPVTDHAQ